MYVMIESILEFGGYTMKKLDITEIILTVRGHPGWGGSQERLPGDSGVFMELKLW